MTAIATHYCNICFTDAGPDVETATPRCNVRKFSSERFTVWRCPTCKSIHAGDNVDLGYYYSGYPFHGSGELDFAQRAVYRNMERRLQAAGLQKNHAILDYGCGSGALITYLRDAGYTDAHGYDQYSEKFRLPELLERRYDCIVSQDVIEHVPDPWDFLRMFDRLTDPGALIAIGTPNAEAVDLKQTEWFIHALHQPYHRHILSSTVLQEAGTKLGWNLVQYYPTEYLNTLVPFINLRFVLHYLQSFDNTMDVAFEKKRVDSWKLWTPLSLWFGLFGYFHSDDSGVMVVYQTPKSLTA